MAWNPPITVSTGQVISASDQNTYVRDNLNHLNSGKAKQVILRDNNADYTTTSATYVDIDSTNLSITLNVQSGAVLLGFSGSFTCGSPGVPYFDFTVDGTRIATAFDGLILLPNTAYQREIVVPVLGLSSGNHTFRPQWKVTNTFTLSLSAGGAGLNMPAVFWAIEL